MTDPRPEPYPSAAPVAVPGPLSTVALVVALLVVVLGLVQQSGILLIAVVGMDFSTYGAFAGVVTVLTILVAATALVLALVALARPGGRRLRTGVALGIAGSTLVAVIYGSLVSAVAGAVG